MTVKGMMQKIIDENICGGDIDFCDDYDERAWCAYCGTRWTAEAEERYARAFALEVYDFVPERGDCGVLVKCDTAADAQALAELLYGMAGHIADSEYDKLFYSEPYHEEPDPERQKVEVVLTDGTFILADQVEVTTLYNAETERAEVGFAVHVVDGDCVPVFARDIVRIIGREVSQ